jgi:tripartite ATP-independent transporter DctP family solute receptor
MTFQKEVDQSSKGSLKVEYYGDAVLGSQKTLIESCRMGSIQMTIAPTTVTQNNILEYGLFTLPFLWPDYKTLRAFLDSADGQALGSLWERQDLKLLGWGHIGWIGVQNKKHPIKSLEDMKGLKIRTMQDPQLVETMDILGAKGVAMGIGELYSAVQQGVIDGISTTAQFLYALKIYEVAKYYSDLKLHTAPAQLLINLKFWRSLAPQERNIILAASKNWEKNNDAYYLDESFKTSDNNVLKLFRELGVETYEPTPEQLSELRKMTKPVFEKYRKKIGPDVVDKVIQFVGYK